MHFGYSLSIQNKEESILAQQFSVGMTIEGYVDSLGHSLQGVILKKYQHSCLVELQQQSPLTRKVLEHMNYRIVLSYATIQQAA